VPVTATIRVPASIPYLDAVLEGLVLANVVYLEAHPKTPRLYESGVRYKRERPGRENWLIIPYLYKRRFGDCEDLGAALAAECIVFDGLDAWAFTVRTGKKKFHTKVCIREDGELFVEDPSRVLGMGKKKKWRESKSR